MPKPKQIVHFLVISLCFVGGAVASLIPTWNFMERFWIEDASVNTPSYFPLLKATDASTGKRIYSFTNYGAGSHGGIVTSVPKNELPKINADLRGMIGQGQSRYDYFKIIAEGPGYTDVSLEIPTLHESKRKGWYRLQDGQIQPQKCLFYGPGFALVVAPISTGIGLAFAMFGSRVMRRFEDRFCQQ